MIDFIRARKARVAMMWDGGRPVAFDAVCLDARNGSLTKLHGHGFRFTGTDMVEVDALDPGGMVGTECIAAGIGIAATPPVAAAPDTMHICSRLGGQRTCGRTPPATRAAPAA